MEFQALNQGAIVGAGLFLTSDAVLGANVAFGLIDANIFFNSPDKNCLSSGFDGL